MTPEILEQATGSTTSRAQEFAVPLTSAMAAYLINTPERQAAFLAQISVESGGLHWLEELWGPDDQQKKYDPPGELAKELGNTVVGDGYKYRGRGLIQTTGKSNYIQLSNALGQDFVTHPELLALPKWASISAAYFWKSHSLNALADEGRFSLITRRINGGLTAEAERLTAWDHCKKLLGVV